MHSCPQGKPFLPPRGISSRWQSPAPLLAAGPQCQIRPPPRPALTLGPDDEHGRGGCLTPGTRSARSAWSLPQPLSLLHPGMQVPRSPFRGSGLDWWAPSTRGTRGTRQVTRAAWGQTGHLCPRGAAGAGASCSTWAGVRASLCGDRVPPGQQVDAGRLGAVPGTKQRDTGKGGGRRRPRPGLPVDWAAS